MTKGLYQQLRETWKKPDEKRLRELVMNWKGENSITKIERPTRLDRARALGYKAKKGFVMVRIKIARGGRKRPKPNKGRKTRKQTNKKVVKMSYQWIAEQRAQKKFRNLEVLNSYYLAKDGLYYFFEIIMVDPERPEIKSDPVINWICKPSCKNRVLRGLTSAGKKSRGLRKKSKPMKVRPSIGAHDHRGK